MLLQHRTESISKSAAQDLTFVIKHPLKFLEIDKDIFLSEGDKGYAVRFGSDAFKRTWNENRDYLYGIPTNERSLSNGALSQNPGWNDGLSF